jgi:hypothetical protein
VPSSAPICPQLHHPVHGFTRWTVSPSSVFETENRHTISQVYQDPEQSSQTFRMSHFGRVTIMPVSAMNATHHLPPTLTPFLMRHAHPDIVPFSPQHPSLLPTPPSIVIPEALQAAVPPPTRWLDLSWPPEAEGSRQSSVPRRQAWRFKFYTPRTPFMRASNSGACKRRIGGCLYRNRYPGNIGRHEEFECKKRTKDEKKAARLKTTCHLCRKRKSFSRPDVLRRHISKRHGGIFYE